MAHGGVRLKKRERPMPKQTARTPNQEKKKLKKHSHKRARVDGNGEDVDDSWVQDAQDMAVDAEPGQLHFLSEARLPDVTSSGAQGRAKERIRDEKRRQREILDAQRTDAKDESDESTDMEGASESDEDEMDWDKDSSEDDLEESDLDEDADEHDPLEDAYLLKAEQREKRARAERHALAQLPLPVRTSEGIIEQPNSKESRNSRAIYEPHVMEDSDDDDDDNDNGDVSKTSPGVTSSSSADAQYLGYQAPYDIAEWALASNRTTSTQAILAAREQIARLSSSIMADPEQGQASLRRLLVFAQRIVHVPPEDPRPRTKRLPMHPYIRQLAMLSLLAVFVDILPGYRIRALSETEQKDRVSQDVARRRDWEQGLVRLYRDYLECCEGDVRDASSPLAPVARKCFCTLLVRAPHFNYRKNLLASIISLLSRKAWTPASEQCFEALAELLRQDADGELGLELVMLLYRMIRERKLAVHANVLEILVHLRLRDELSRRVRRGPMGSANASNSMPTASEVRHADPRQVRKGLAVHRSKKQVKRDRELRQIEHEMREADATLDLEERERRQSETLKLMFALYFRILKTDDVPLPLLASALEGLVHFAHHVSADFFRDVVGVLRTHVTKAIDAHEPRHALLCIVAALELQAGQGGALELDLGAFYVALYQVMWPLAISSQIEEGAPRQGSSVRGLRSWSMASMLFHALELALVKSSRSTLHVSLDRTAAMLRRLLMSALHWPTTTTLHALQIAHAILARAASVDTRFEALVDNRDAIHDGTFDPYSEQPESARVLASGQPCWELIMLSRTHANAQVRETASALLEWTP